MKNERTAEELDHAHVVALHPDAANCERPSTACNGAASSDEISSHSFSALDTAALTTVIRAFRCSMSQLIPHWTDGLRC